MGIGSYLESNFIQVYRRHRISANAKASRGRQENAISSRPQSKARFDDRHRKNAREAVRPLG